MTCIERGPGTTSDPPLWARTDEQVAPGSRPPGRREAGAAGAADSSTWAMSREELAAACSRSVRLGPRVDVRHYEEAGRPPPVPTFAALAGALGVSMEALLYGEDETARLAADRRRDG